MQPDRSYLVCATPRSGSTLVCHALEETGVAGRPEEYFEALRHSGRPRRPEEYFLGVEDQSIRDHLGERSVGNDPRPAPPSGAGPPTTATSSGPSRPAPRERRLRGEADVGLLRRVRQPAAQRPRLPRRAAGGAAAGRSSPTSPSSASCARTRSARRSRSGRRCRPRPGARTTRERQGGLGRGRRLAALPQLHRGAPAAAALPLPGDRPPARPAPDRRGLLGRLLRALRGSSRSSSSTRTSPPTTRPAPSTCSTASASPAAEDFEFEPRMKRQSDRINDDWTRRYSELRLGTETSTWMPVPVER